MVFGFVFQEMGNWETGI